MSALQKMTSFLGYSQPVEDDYDEGYETAYADHGYEAEATYAAFDEEAHASVPDLRRIVTVHPTTYNEARVIGEAFRDGVPVIINLTHMGEADARRMVDFSAGLVFGLNGAIERVTPRVFLLTPATVEIDGGEQGEESSRFFNQS